MRFIRRRSRRLMRPQHAMRRRPLAIRELIQVTTLATSTRTHHVAGNLRATPNLGRKTDRTTTRGAIGVAAIRPADGDRGRDSAEGAEGALTQRTGRMHDEILDAE